MPLAQQYPINPPRSLNPFIPSNLPAFQFSVWSSEKTHSYLKTKINRAIRFNVHLTINLFKIISCSSSCWAGYPAPELLSQQHDFGDPEI